MEEAEKIELLRSIAPDVSEEQIKGQQSSIDLGVARRLD